MKWTPWAERVPEREGPSHPSKLIIVCIYSEYDGIKTDGGALCFGSLLKKKSTYHIPYKPCKLYFFMLGTTDIWG